MKSFPLFLLVTIVAAAAYGKKDPAVANAPPPDGALTMKNLGGWMAEREIGDFKGYEKGGEKFY